MQCIYFVANNFLGRILKGLSIKGINMILLKQGKTDERSIVHDRLRLKLRENGLSHYRLNAVNGAAGKVILDIVCGECFAKVRNKKGGKMSASGTYNSITGVSPSEILEVKWVRRCECVPASKEALRGLERKRLQSKGLSGLEMRNEHAHNIHENVINNGRLPSGDVMRKAKSEVDLPPYAGKGDDGMHLAILQLQKNSAEEHFQHVRANRPTASKYRPTATYFGMIQHVGNPRNRENATIGDIPVIIFSPDIIKLAHVWWWWWWSLCY